MRQTTHFSFEKALAVCHAETAAETVGTRDTELGKGTKRSSETYHEQTHGRFGHELDSHDGMVLWFVVLMDECWRCPGGMIFLRPPFSLLLLLFVDPQSGPGAHLCPDEVLTQSRPTPPAATFYVSSATSVDAADSLGALTALPLSPESL